MLRPFSRPIRRRASAPRSAARRPRRHGSCCAPSPRAWCRGSGTGRTRPTVTVIPPPLPASSLGCGRSGASDTSIGTFGALGRPSVLRLARERPQRGADFIGRRPGVERDRHRRRVPIDHRHASRLRAQDHAVGRDRIVCVSAEDLLGLALDLFLLAGDGRNDVAEDVEGRHAGISGARDRLQRRHHHRAQAELRAAAPAPSQ